MSLRIPNTTGLGILCIAFGAAPALAQDEGGQGAQWTIGVAHARTIAGGGDEFDPNSKSFSASLERSLGEASLGVSGGLTSRDFEFENAVSSSDIEGFAIGAWASRYIDATTLTLALDYAQEKGDALFQAAGGPELAAEGKNKLFSVSGTASRVFGGVTRFAPAISVGWSRTETSIAFNSARLPQFEGAVENDGVFGSAGASFAHDFGEHVTLYAGAAGVAAQNAASVFQSTQGRTTSGAGGLYEFGDAGSDVWGEYSAGVIFSRQAFGGKSISITLDVSGSAGLPEDFVAAAVSTSFSF
ncbi:hypothetical protein [Hyphococcus sp.]|uniref:hypothetical protein n=1 Tax=Hyphococcus sp. TaxID=2038636 RepID=UPI0035C6D1C9